MRGGGGGGNKRKTALMKWKNKGESGRERLCVRSAEKQLLYNVTAEN